MQEANGKIETPDNIERLQKLMGHKPRNVFGVDTEEKLEAKMNEMSNIDLQRMCVSAGQTATGSIPVLKEKIRRSFARFKKDMDGYRLQGQSKPIGAKNPEKAKSLMWG